MHKKPLELKLRMGRTDALFPEVEPMLTVSFTDETSEIYNFAKILDRLQVLPELPPPAVEKELVNDLNLNGLTVHFNRYTYLLIA
jgi:hypothetical protein